MKHHTVSITNVKHVLSWVLCLVMILSLVPAAYATDGPAVSTNINTHDYQTYGTTIKSYLYDNGHGLTRVEFINNSVTVEEYDSSFHYLSRRTIPMELSIWGGFYAGETANFLIFGQENPNQNDSQEVIRVVKYSKDWQRQGQASLYGANTTVPFDSGSLRCAEYGGYLYVRTSHEMYKSSDGVNHQASAAFSVRQSDMVIVSGDNVGTGYVSHSFNQFLLIDSNQNIVTVDHGDANPRSFFIQKYSQNPDGDFGSRVASNDIVKFPGESGKNSTGSSVGGLAETSTGYVTAYNYDGQGGLAYPRDIYLGYTTKEGSTSTITQVTTDNCVSTPVLAPVDLNNGYILWNKTNRDHFSFSQSLYYTTYSDGGAIGEIHVANNAALSDCQPISYNGKMVWYVTNNSAPIFYGLDASGIQTLSAPVANTAAPSTNPAGGNPFSDVRSDHWAYNSIIDAYNDGVMTGTTATTFAPDGVLDVAQFVTVLTRAFYNNDVLNSKRSGDWPNQNIDAAEVHDLFNGITHWMSYWEVTREMMAQIMYNVMIDQYMDLPSDQELQSVMNSIPDISSVDANYRTAVATCYYLNLLTGTDSVGNFSPQKHLSRAETAVIYARLKAVIA